jgi:hypothetical protein
MATGKKEHHYHDMKQCVRANPGNDSVAMSLNKEASTITSWFCCHAVPYAQHNFLNLCSCLKKEQFVG